MKKTSTRSFLLNFKSHDDNEINFGVKSKSDLFHRIYPRKSTINNIIMFSKSIRCYKSKLIDDVFINNN